MLTILEETRGFEPCTVGSFETELEADQALYEMASNLEDFDEDCYTSSGYNDNDTKLTVIGSR